MSKTFIRQRDICSDIGLDYLQLVEYERRLNGVLRAGGHSTEVITKQLGTFYLKREQATRKILNGISYDVPEIVSVALRRRRFPAREIEPTFTWELLASHQLSTFPAGRPEKDGDGAVGTQYEMDLHEYASPPYSFEPNAFVMRFTMVEIKDDSFVFDWSLKVPQSEVGKNYTKDTQAGRENFIASGLIAGREEVDLTLRFISSQQWLRIFSESFLEFRWTLRVDTDNQSSNSF